MGWFSWLVIIIIIFILVWCLKWVINGKDLVRFIGLEPLLGNLSSMKKYLHSVGRSLDDMNQLPVSQMGQQEQIEPKKAILHIPSSWDFSDIRGKGKRERIVRRVLETLFQLDFPNVRPDWLRNPKTSQKLEIDLFAPSLNLACEVQGEAHYMDGGFNKTREMFISQLYRDKVKKEQILARGIDLLLVPYTVKIRDIPSYVITHLRELGWE